MPRKVNRNPGIERRGDKWRARAFLGGVEKTKTFATQDEALRWKRETQRSLERGEWIDPNRSSVLFQEWAEMWLVAKTDISGQTYRGYVSQLKNHLNPYFGKMKLTAITNNQIGQWIAREIESGTGEIVIKRSHALLRQILNSALMDGRLSRNPAIGVPLPRTKSKKKTALTPVQLNSLAQECNENSLLIQVAGMTGLRWGELAALQVKDVSLLGRTINVSKSVALSRSGKKVIGATKTNTVRTVPIAKDLLPLLEKQLEGKSPLSPLFARSDGKVLDYNNFMSRIFRPAVKRLGYSNVSFHSLRHTTASLLISQGAPVTAVSGILGHASTQMTLDVYGHLYKDDASKYIDRLGNSLFDTGTDKERTSNVFEIGSVAN
jgi:integrase